ncbi:hypothetical protein PANT_25d00062 [Moesziomyces antarcticus T-34]|uniref:chorismate mutase n=1 Tax=Pseudozyma antarctica (strain T-34) TaxID=1151754 RepID=M9LSY4_PSEA3|nr:hypothetical protein PANT_25d00062 [Moesziomyces antarcticus T-34]
MKVLSLVSALVSASVLVHAAAIEQAATADADPLARLDELRLQLQRYETPIIHAYLSRAALGASIDMELSRTQFIFESLTTAPKAYEFTQPNANITQWLTEGGKAFSVSAPFPPATWVHLPVVLPDDAVLDKPVVGKGIFPVGRRRRDPANLYAFLFHNFAIHKHDPTLDTEATALLEASLLRLISARIVIGHEIALAKFESNPQAYCSILKKTPVSEKELVQQITDEKQQVNVLGRVQQKAKDMTKLYRQDQKYPEGTEDQVLRLFQAYIIPLTTNVEVVTLLDQAKNCK